MEATITSGLGAQRGLVSHATSLMRRVFLSEVPYLKGLTWKRVAWSFAIAAAFGLNSMLGNIADWTGGRFAAPIRLYVEEFVHWFPKFVVAYVPLMLLATVADNVAARGVARVAAFAAALVLGVAAIPIDFCLFQLWSVTRCSLSFQYFTNMVVDLFILQFVPFSAIIGAVWLAHRRDASIAAGLHAAMMERLALQRQTLETGLRIVQSRIEPTFLLDTLTDVSRRCATDPASAECIVDQLVLYLRGTLPDVREEGTTLGRELQVAASYLELVALRSGGSVRFAIDAPNALSDTRMAPMVLMPLVARMLPEVPNAVERIPVCVTGAASSDDSVPTTLRIEAEATSHDVHLRVTCTDSRRITPSDPFLSGLRARLADLYGGSASLRIDARPTQVSVSLALPHVPVARFEEEGRQACDDSSIQSPESGMTSPTNCA